MNTAPLPSPGRRPPLPTSGPFSDDVRAENVNTSHERHEGVTVNLLLRDAFLVAPLLKQVVLLPGMSQIPVAVERDTLLLGTPLGEQFLPQPGKLALERPDGLLDEGRE